MKSPIVRIELASPLEVNPRLTCVKNAQISDSVDEHIASMPDVNNDSMVGDLN